MKWALVLCSLLLFQSEDPSLSWTYEEHPLLSWDDFRGVPPQSVDRAASVNSGMSYQFSKKTSNGKITDLDIKVESGFYPELSWKLDLNESSRELLKHEQLHWDITHLFTLRLRATYKRYRPVKNVKREIDFIFRKFERDRATMQAKYDAETNHGLNREAQQKWEIFVNGELLKVEI
ncbi:MAG: DUF922 domain-containing protein [Nonlabens sp.]